MEKNKERLDKEEKITFSRLTKILIFFRLKYKMYLDYILIMVCLQNDAVYIDRHQYFGRNCCLSSRG
jgi:hypothetical protein